MKREQIEKIKGYYDSRGEFKKNSQYSGEQGIVYTKAGDNAHWLIIEQKGEIGAEVRQTDDTGRITARDTYESVRNTVKCTGVSRKRAEGKGMVRFEPDEINLIYQFGENGRQGTVDMLKAIEPKIADRLTKGIVSSTIHKLSALSEESCSELISSTENRKLAERDSSIRKRLADAQKKVEERAGTGRNSIDRKKKNSLSL
ncbi:MAG: transposon-transfer assisting family protein [Schaedlerella sp.]|jgi:hypothetical protein|uniref:transposon-transfer assisting family protein n=1 Tax=Schaedlerella sp. TaxID=2676057 RepID=UPI00033886B6|nr:hypothetical protein C817_04285 [Dorea sp. 5-2]